MNPHEQIKQFNARVGWGDGVDFTFNGRTISTTTRALAQVLHDGRAVIWLDGREGAVDLDRVKPNGLKAAALPSDFSKDRDRHHRKRILRPKVAST